MKKLLPFIVFSILATVSSFAANTSTINVVATVGSQLSLTTTVPSTVNLDVVGGTSTALGDLTVFSNATGNWRIIVHSTNAGKMVGDTSGNTGTYPYKFVFGSDGEQNLSTDFIKTLSGTTGSAGYTYAMAITYVNYASLTPVIQADTYRDVITVTIESI